MPRHDALAATGDVRGTAARAVGNVMTVGIALAQDLARLVVPVACAGCLRLDVRLCDECEAPWWEEPFRAEEGAARLQVLGRTPLPTWAVAELDGTAHAAIAAWKEGGRRDLDTFFAATARRAAAHVAPHLAQPLAAGPLVVVPVPSAKASVRRRGADLTGLLAKAVARELVDSGASVTVTRSLVSAGVRSRGRSSAARWDAARVRARPASPAACAVLVDDVMTTGATLARASAALEEAGTAVAGALVLAATPRRGASAGRALV